jgi:uracil phosphoribosyltransferase
VLSSARVMPVTVVRHPLVEDALARLRERTTPCDEFRRLARRVSVLLAAEATRDLPTSVTEIDTPLERTLVSRVAPRIVAVPVLRAGLGMLDAFLELLPQTQVGYFGLERNEETAVARRYYEKVPKDLGGAVVFLLDPMLATGGSAAMAVDGLRGLGATQVRLLSIVAAPEGVAYLEQNAPDTHVFTAALDRALNDRKYILPGLGDFGDRLFGT